VKGVLKLTAPTGGIKADVQLPASKSISNRLLILNALSNAPAHIGNISDSDDTKAVSEALASAERIIDICAAGTAMRFLTAYLAVTPGIDKVITGSARMKNRPIGLLVDSLRSLGANIRYMGREGFPPLHIRGKQLLPGGELSVDGNVSSQFISALLMAAPRMENGLTLHITGDVASAPYILMTTGLMNRFGINTEWDGNTIRVGHAEYIPVQTEVEADWSAASYWYSLLAVNGEGEVKLRGLSAASLQGDAAVATLFEPLGVTTEFTDEGIILRPSERSCKRMDYNFINEPDLAQTLVVCCCLLNVPFRFTGLAGLKIKETDRIEALRHEMQKCGYMLNTPADDTLEWTGKRCTAKPCPFIHTYEDHRMAMAFSAVACVFEQGVTIESPSVVTKSYPGYWRDLRESGFVAKA
jgi:3-phosphoshikimate 1-carboxyvinyltransferase